MHLKRNKAPKKWSIKRKGTKYIIRSHNVENSIPLLIVLRDLLKIVKNRKECKNLLNLGKIKVNGRKIREEKFPLSLFDVLDLDGKNFKIIFKNRKFNVQESKDAGEKIAKVIGKKILKGNKLQVNLQDGRNYLTKEKVKVGDSVMVDLKENKIKEILQFKSGCKVLFISGKHLGIEGVAENTLGKLISVKIGKEKINSEMINLMVVK